MMMTIRLLNVFTMENGSTFVDNLEGINDVFESDTVTVLENINDFRL